MQSSVPRGSQPSKSLDRLFGISPLLQRTPQPRFSSDTQHFVTHSGEVIPRVAPTCRALPVCVLPSCPLLAALCSPLCVEGRHALRHRHTSGRAALPQGSSLRSGFCCPSPSTLIRPHPPHSQAQRDFAALQLIRPVFAVRFRLGDPRLVPSFHYSFFLNMSSSARAVYFVINVRSPR
jgi:hypothetical protein